MASEVPILYHKEKRLSFGVYPDVSLKDARERRDEARKLLAQGTDPSANPKAVKSARADRAANSFEVVTREWFAKHSPNWAEHHSERILRRFERDIFPWLGGRPVAEIVASELLVVLRRIEERGALETGEPAESGISRASTGSTSGGACSAATSFPFLTSMGMSDGTARVIRRVR